MKLKEIVLCLLAMPLAIYAANDFSLDNNCIALYTMDEATIDVATLSDSKNSNVLTNSGVAEDTTNYKTNGCAGLYAQNADVAYITDAGMQSDYPLKNGTANGVFSFCGWIRPTTLAASKKIFIKGVTSTNNANAYLQVVDTGGSTYELRFAIGHNNGSSWEILNTTTTNLSTNTWYHWAVTFNDSTKAWTMRVHDESALWENDSGTATNNVNIETARLNIGEYNNDAMLGQQDEFVVFKDILSNDEIDQIWEGVYPEGAGAGAQVVRYEQGPWDGHLIIPPTLESLGVTL